nr:hypothetical protein CFP56_64734 [Quercus suber]
MKSTTARMKRIASVAFTSSSKGGNRTRDSPHLNWHSVSSVDVSSNGSPLDRLEWETSRASGHGSVMLRVFGKGSGYPLSNTRRLQMRGEQLQRADETTRIRDRDALLRLSSWQVVVQVIVIHSDLEAAASTDLWRLFGEEVVQIVDIADEQRCDIYYKLAEECEQRASTHVTVPQNYRRESLDAIQRRLTHDILKAFECEDLVKIMHPAIMFRLCTARCNERELSESDDENGPY